MYMIYQQVTTAIKEAYDGRDDVIDHLATAHLCREWLESLDIDPDLRNGLVEPIRVVEEAFRDLAP